MAWLLLASTWCLLLLAGAASPWLGQSGSLLTGHAACALLLVWARRIRPQPAGWGPSLLAGAAGFVSLPAWALGVGALGLGLGLPTHVSPMVHLSPGFVWLAHVVFAPVFEELLYRERLLPALLPRVGRAPALVLTSALFALPHAEAWTMLATLCVGLFLGALQLACGRVGLCIGYHAGANAAVLLLGFAPSLLALDPGAAAFASLATLAAAMAWTTRHGPGLAVHGAGEPGRPVRPPQACRLHRMPPCRRSRTDGSPLPPSARV